jgi:uncharacterized membrane-anchored protein
VFAKAAGAYIWLKLTPYCDHESVIAPALNSSKGQYVTETKSLANKVADVTLAFWVMKIAATTVGETGGDMFSMTLRWGYIASTIMLLGIFVVALFFQLRAKTFRPVLYWTVILATSTAGTTISDMLDRTFGLGYAMGASLIAATLVGVLVVWRFTTGSLAVDHISGGKTEVFYWLAILTSNTLGTALGDFLADSSGLGYLWSNALISAGIAAIAIAFFTTKISRTGLFWAAFVLTRPFGATMGDLLTKLPAKGGLGFGTMGSSAVLLSILAVMIWWTYGREKRVA